MSAATHDQHIRTLIDRLELFGFRAPVIIPADMYPDYLQYWLYATERGSRPLIGVTAGVCQLTPQCSSRRSR
jgi:hypothetical protein